ncbi:hypothetical protein BY996DRAFT_6807573, partial [Phakopsora pachyrhizi]
MCPKECCKHCFYTPILFFFLHYWFSRPSKYPARASSAVNSVAHIKSVPAMLFWLVLVTF